jgi:UDPglucose--hexose-1-phosphate uridylyltransferase
MPHTDNKAQFPDRRWNLLRRSWVPVSPHRTERPWQGEVSLKTMPQAVSHDPECSLCTGNTRVGRAINPAYDGVFSFVNDRAALLPDPSEITGMSSSSLAEPARGLCKVLCHHPDHSLTLARMNRDEIRPVIDAWIRETIELGDLDWIQYVQVVENRGAIMGAGNPHSHSQIWSTGFVPDEPAAETQSQREHLARTGRCLLCDYVAVERAVGQRVIFENKHFMALVPWWAAWPFEVLLISRRHARTLPELFSDERDGLADALKRLTTRYDNLFEVGFPYTMGFHQAPTTGVVTTGAQHPEWHFHAHFYPPPLRSATVRKFKVGFEMLGMPHRDFTPETAARSLRECSEQHLSPRDWELVRS